MHQQITLSFLIVYLSSPPVKVKKITSTEIYVLQSITLGQEVRFLPSDIQKLIKQ